MRLGVTATAMMPYMVQYWSVANMKKANQKKLPARMPKTSLFFSTEAIALTAFVVRVYQDQWLSVWQ